MNLAPAQGLLFDDPADAETPNRPAPAAIPETPIPAAVRIVVTRSPDKTDPERRPLLLAVVLCPFCGRQHIHPAGRAGQPRLGVRRSRCIGRTGALYKLGCP